MAKNKDKALAVTYIRRIYIAGEGTLSYDKEFLIRRKPSEYGLLILNGIRYVMFFCKDEDKLIVIGKKLGGNKQKNYFLSAFPRKMVMSKEELKLFKGNIYKEKLNNLILGKKDLKEKFEQFVQKTYDVS